MAHSAQHGVQVEKMGWPPDYDAVPEFAFKTKYLNERMREVVYYLAYTDPEEQVQEWIGVIGLSSDSVQVVQGALAADEYDGDDLKAWTAVYQDFGSAKRLLKLLKKKGCLKKRILILFKIL